jgi:hypothetical protein
MAIVTGGELLVRTLRKLGVAMGTAGPGFTNLLTSITNAYRDRTPVLYLSGSAGLAQAETNTLQAGFDQVAMAAPVTLWAHRVSDKGHPTPCGPGDPHRDLGTDGAGAARPADGCAVRDTW